MKYLALTIKHKWFVLLAGLRVKCPLIRLLLHDWSKFLPSEMPHYQRQFYGPADDPAGFAQCWVHHHNRNEHHWEYWIPRTGHNRADPPMKVNEPIPMPLPVLREMIADWLGASRAYTGIWPWENNWEWPWFHEHWHEIRLHPDTRIQAEAILRFVGMPRHCFADNAKARFYRKAKERLREKEQNAATQPKPRYDAVYDEGTRKLDELAGPPLIGEANEQP